jgi:mediator of RNA polymerase II transcription subunit 8
LLKLTLTFQVFEKVTQLILKKVNSEREEMESRSGARNDLEKTTSTDDTMELMSAVSYGHNLRPMTYPMPMPSPTPSNQARGSPQVQAKAVSSIKTNIKAATQVHPYQRN